MQNCVVIGRAYFKPEHCTFWFNFEFDRNMVSGTGAWTTQLLTLGLFITFENTITCMWYPCNNSIIDAGLPPDSLAVDHQRLYWTKRGEGVLISVDKATGGSLVRETLADIEEILAYGAHLQPLPGMIGCHYNTVQYDVISHTALQYQNQNINQSLNSQKTPHIYSLPSRVSYRLSITPLH